MNLESLKFWKKKVKNEPVVTYGLDPGMYPRLKHILTYDCDGLSLPGKTPEEQSAIMNSAKWLNVYFGNTKEITADDIRKALENN